VIMKNPKPLLRVSVIGTVLVALSLRRSW